jgi:TonB family protein
MSNSRQLILTFLICLDVFCFGAVKGFSQINMPTNQHRKSKKAIPVIKETVIKPAIDSSLFYEYHPEDRTRNIYKMAEILAKPIGGSYALNKFLSDSTRYPLDERERGINGRVIVSFIIEKDGQLSNVTVIKGVSPGLDAEAIRLFKSMPKWSPAMNDGKAVRIYYSLPLFFNLNEQ